MKKRSHRVDKMARVYDDEILPIWSQRFGRMLLRRLELPPKAMVLDVGCGTGFPSLELLERMDEQSRIIAIDPVSALLDVARKKAGELAGRRIFFRSEPATAKLAFADEVYDLVISNLGLLLLDDPARAIREFGRVAKQGGQVMVTLPLAGTYDEFYDIYREVLIKNDKKDVLERLEDHVSQMPDPDQVLGWFEAAELVQVDLEVEQFSLLFKSSREFFFAPVIEFGPLSAWKEVAGKGQVMQEIFWHIKEAIDAYFGERAFELTVKAGCVRGRRDLAPPSPAEVLSGEGDLPELADEPEEAITADELLPAKALSDDFMLDEDTED